MVHLRYWRILVLIPFFLDVPTYMEMYSFVNVENLNLYEPPMIMDEDESIQVPPVDDFSPKYLDEL
jgi:hypothetical protein